MGGRRARRIGIAALLLLIFAAAGVRVVLRGVLPAGTGDAAGLATAPDAPDTGDASALRRERKHVARGGADAGEGAAGAGATEAVPAPEPPDAGGAQAPGAPATAEPEQVTKQLDLAVARAAEQAAESTLVAVPERDPLRAADPSRVGAPPELAFASFVTRGVTSIDGAAELVGERRPELERGEPVALTGRVLDGETRRPLAGARVVVWSTFYVRRHLYDHHLREVASALTDDDGEFAVARVDVDPAHFGRGGRLYVTVSADGHVTSPARPLASVAPGSTSRLPDVRLAVAPCSLRGRVVDMWEGQPVAGARIYATGAIDPIAYPKDQRVALFLGVPSAVTDDEGRFELTGLGEGVQIVSAHGGDDCLGRETFVVPRDSDVTLRTRSIGGRIEGTVLDARGEPVPLVAVQGGGNSTHTFQDGSFVLENFREDHLEIVFTHPDFRHVVLQDVADGTVGVQVRMEHVLPEIRLRVRRADDGAAVTEIRVVPRAAEGGAVRMTSPAHLSDEGVHVLRVPEGAATLSVASAGLRAAEIDLAGIRDGDALELVLEPGGGD